MSHKVDEVISRIEELTRTGYTAEEIVGGQNHSLTVDSIAGELGYSLTDNEHRAVVEYFEDDDMVLGYTDAGIPII